MQDRGYSEKNKVQELITKYQELPKDIEWHMIGHLQSNKVKYIVSLCFAHSFSRQQKIT
jgi:uncharacterized pyridoxal phosphate-containing UPF0001 family protein